MAFSNLKLRNKIIFPVISVILLLVAFIVVYVSITTANLVGNFTDDRMAAATQAIRAYLQANEQQTRIAASAMGGSSELIRRIDAGNRDAIWQYVAERKAFLGVDEIIVGSADGVTLARSHMRDSYGDDISGVPSVAAALRRETITLYTPTPTASMVMTSTSPIMDGDRFVGTIVVNFVVGRGVADTDEFLDRLGATFNADFTVFNRDGESVSSTLMHPVSGARAVGTVAAPHIVEGVIERGGDMMINLNVFGMLPYLAYYFPLPGVDGSPNGMFFIGIPLEEAMAISNTQRIYMIVIGVVGLIVVALIVLRIAGSISKPLKIYEEWMHATSTEGNVEWTAEEGVILERYKHRRDEIGGLFRAYVALTEYIKETCGELQRVADGELDFDVTVRSDSDNLSKALQKMVSDLNDMFGEINRASRQVSAGSQQIADGSQSLAQGSTEQAATVQQLSASAQEISEKTRTNAQMAGKAAELAGTIKGNAEKGSKQMDDMVGAVNEISQASQSISKVIKVIDDIAFQTNILALNAAVEAARAGQHGKGFAVVADEVRTLAAKSAEAAKDTGALISNSMEKSEQGARIATETAESLTEIVAGINESSEIISEIAMSSEAQTAGISQINSGIDQVASVVQQNSATAEESAASAEELSGQSATLESLISRFKLKNSGSMRGASLTAKPAPSAPPANPGATSFSISAGTGKY